MTAPVPQTIASEITKAINALILESDRFHGYDDPAIVDLLDRAKKLQKVDARASLSLQGTIAALCADIDGTLELFRKALLLPGVDETRVDYLVALGNVGLYSRAQEIIGRLLEPRLGYFGDLWPRALSMGAVRAVHERLPAALRAYPDLQKVDFSLVAKAYDVVHSNGVLDAHVAATLDLMGEVERMSGIMFCGRHASEVRVVAPPDDAPYLYFAMPIDAETTAVHEMNRALASLAVDRLPNGVFPRGVVASFKRATEPQALRAAA